MTEPDISVNLGGIALDSPVLAASGPFGHGCEYSGLLDLEALGGIIVKGVSLEPWPGNPPPRLAETAGGLVNSIGLQNPGLKVFLKRDLPRLRRLGPRLVVNIAGRTVEEYAALASALDGAAGIDGIEVNVSCPNLQAGGLAFGVDPAATARVVGAVRSSTALPLLVKLPPILAGLTEICRAAEEAGADALSLINTLPAMLIDIERKRPLLGGVFGGLSGPAVLPVALKMVWQAAEAVRIPILGTGGVTGPEDAIQFILAGARAVAIGTGLFYDHALPAAVRDGIAAYMSEHGFETLARMEGLARKSERGGEYER